MAIKMLSDITLEQMINLPVRVYRNLHKQSFSIQYRGKVIAHADEISLSDATFTVQPAGRAKVLATKKKTVHAFVNGKVCAGYYQGLDNKVTYNPFKAATFIVVSTGEPITKARLVTLQNNQVFIPQR